MAKKSDLLAYAEQNGWTYPKYRVLFQFSFIGSLIGTFMFSTVFFILDKIKNPVEFDPVIILAPFVIAFFGWIVGFFPALLTGISIALAKIRIVNQTSYWKIFLIGFLCTTLCLLVWLMIMESYLLEFEYKDIIIALSIASTGGLSSVICGKLFLPKFDLQTNL